MDGNYCFSRQRSCYSDIVWTYLLEKHLSAENLHFLSKTEYFGHLKCHLIRVVIFISAQVFAFIGQEGTSIVRGCFVPFGIVFLLNNIYVEVPIYPAVYIDRVNDQLQHYLLGNLSFGWPPSRRPCHCKENPVTLYLLKIHCRVHWTGSVSVLTLKLLVVYLFTEVFTGFAFGYDPLFLYRRNSVTLHRKTEFHVTNLLS